MVRTGWQQMIVLQQNIMQAQAHKQDTTQIGLYVSIIQADSLAL